jgi:hypothetical protein
MCVLFPRVVVSRLHIFWRFCGWFGKIVKEIVIKIRRNYACSTWWSPRWLRWHAWHVLWFWVDKSIHDCLRNVWAVLRKRIFSWKLGSFSKKKLPRLTRGHAHVVMKRHPAMLDTLAWSNTDELMRFLRLNCRYRFIHPSACTTKCMYFSFHSNNVGKHARIPLRPLVVILLGEFKHAHVSQETRMPTSRFAYQHALPYGA